MNGAGSIWHIPLVLAAIMRLQQPSRRMGDFEHEDASVCAHSAMHAQAKTPAWG